VTVVNSADAEAGLDGLLERAAAGEEIVIAQHGQPVARLVPIAARRVELPQLGRLAGQVWVAPDFDDPLPDELVRAFNGELS
jgi:prevent-host-death family protein